MKFECFDILTINTTKSNMAYYIDKLTHIEGDYEYTFSVGTCLTVLVVNKAKNTTYTAHFSPEYFDTSEHKIINTLEMAFDVLCNGMRKKSSNIRLFPYANYARVCIIIELCDSCGIADTITLNMPRINEPVPEPVVPKSTSTNTGTSVVAELQKINKRLDALEGTNDILREIKASLSNLTVQFENMRREFIDGSAKPVPIDSIRPSIAGSAPIADKIKPIFGTHLSHLIYSDEDKLTLSYNGTDGVMEILCGDKYEKLTNFDPAQIKEFTNLTEFTIMGAPLTDICFLQHNTNLKCLSIIRERQNPVTSLSLASIANNPNIETIEIYGNYRVTELRALTDCKKLKLIKLPDGTEIGDLPLDNLHFDIAFV